MKNVINFLVNETRNIWTSLRMSYQQAPPALQKGARRLLGLGLILVVLVVGWDQGRTYYDRKQREEEIRKGPHVKIAKAVDSAAERNVNLVGEARPYASVTLYAKVSGYLKQVKVDKGDVVKQGQVLAVIESPETDRAFDGAAADAKNKKAIEQRVAKLFGRSLVSQQEMDQARSDSEVASAHLESAKVLKSYEILRAPFDGTITSRFADPGALVQNATSSQTSALPVLAISQVNELRVYVYLDQRDALAVEKGQAAEISLSENPDVKFAGHVERISGELDLKTRMLLTEIDLDNQQGKIVAGSLVQVSLQLKAVPGVEVPSEALVLREGKTVVPVVNDDNEVTYTEVKVLDNDGVRLKLQSGLQAGQRVALSLGNTLSDHGKIRPLEEGEAGKAH